MPFPVITAVIYIYIIYMYIYILYMIYIYIYIYIIYIYLNLEKIRSINIFFFFVFFFFLLIASFVLALSRWLWFSLPLHLLGISHMGIESAASQITFNSKKHLFSTPWWVILKGLENLTINLSLFHRTLLAKHFNHSHVF